MKLLSERIGLGTVINGKLWATIDLKGVIIEMIWGVTEIKEPNIKYVVSIEIMGGM